MPCVHQQRGSTGPFHRLVRGHDGVYNQHPLWFQSPIERGMLRNKKREKPTLALVFTLR